MCVEKSLSMSGSELRRALPTSRLPAAVQTWTQKHATWWDKDPTMTHEAIALFDAVAKDMRGRPIQDQLAAIEGKMSRLYPEKFAKPAAGQHVEGGSRQPGSSAPRGKGWADMPPDDRKQAERFITRDGVFLPKGVTKKTATKADWAKARAAYAKEYWTE